MVSETRFNVAMWLTHDAVVGQAEKSGTGVRPVKSRLRCACRTTHDAGHLALAVLTYLYSPDTITLTFALADRVAGKKPRGAIS
jgi:hypothetical protein